MPTSFPQLSATQLYKYAVLEGAPQTPERTWGQFGKQLVFGKGPSHALDPMNRGLAADALMYSNAFTGVPTAINDTARHLRNGRWGQAAGSVGMGALSFIPGAASAVGTLGRGALKATGMAAAGTAAKQFGQQAARTTGRAITNTMARAGRQTGNATLDTAARGMNNFARSGRQAVEAGQNAITNTAQKLMPNQQFKYTNWQHGVQNPLSNGAGGWGLRAPVNTRNWTDGAAFRSGLDTIAQNPASSATLLHGYGTGGIMDEKNMPGREQAHIDWLDRNFSR
jgi:hypothetical protein